VVLIAFSAADGTEWDVVVGRESWGTVVAMFVPRKGNAPPRQAVMDTSSSEEALTLLRNMSQRELQDLLDKATPKPME
jgi:hypothetical protein